MSIISSNLYKALLKAGVPEVEAEKASAEVAESKHAITTLESSVQTKIHSFTKEADSKFEQLSGKLEVLTTKVNIALNLLITLVGGMIVAFLGYIFTLVHH